MRRLPTTKADVLIISDLHLHDWPDFNLIDAKTGLGTRFLEGLDILTQATELAISEGIYEVVCLGDVFELKDRVPNHMLQEFKRRIRGGMQYHFLMGNHDFNLEKYPTMNSIWSSSDINVQFYSVCTITTVGKRRVGFIPFMRKWEDFRRSWTEVINESIDTVFIHQAIPGAVYDNGHIIEGTFDLPWKEGLVCISGHLHRGQTFQNGKAIIHFVGSPYHFTFKDVGIEKVIWLFNSETRGVSDVELAYRDFKDVGIESTDNVNGSYVRVVGETDEGTWTPLYKKNLEKKLYEWGAKGVVFNVTVKKARQVRITKKEAQDDRLLIRKYAKENAKGMDVNKVIEAGEGLWKSLSQGLKARNSSLSTNPSNSK